MKIAVNTKSLLTDKLEEYGDFIREIFSRLMKNHGEQEFITVVPHKWWNGYKLPKAVRNKIDVFVSVNGTCSSGTAIPQYMIIYDRSLLHKKNTGKYLKKANSIIVTSDFIKKEIVDDYIIDPGKIDIVYGAARQIFQPITIADKQNIKDKYTEGREYFLYAGAIQADKNLMNLLKGFSIFKKRQQTNMKLILAGKRDEALIKKLRSYKYRDDVVVVDAENELVQLMGAAYAFIDPSITEGVGIKVMEAMRTGTPIIASNDGAISEIAKEAGMYFDPNNFTDIGEKMMWLYKDESLRKQMAEKTKTVSDQYDWEKSANLLLEMITKTPRSKDS